MAEDVALSVASQVEVAVLGEIHGCRPVGDGVVVEDQLVGVCEGVGHRRSERAGVALFTIRARVIQDETDAVGALERRDAPDHLVEALHAAVQVIGAVVRGQGVGPAVQREPAAGDAVAVPADEGAEVR